MALYSEVAGDGPELVLLHEGICDSRMWDTQWDAYTRGHRVLRLDFRGYGRTPYSPEPYASARDVIELMDAHGFQRAAVVGVSLGGRVALEVALAVPDRVSALVLVAPGLPGHDWSEEMQATWGQEETALRGGDVNGAVDLVLRTWVAGPGRELEDVDPEVRARVAEMQRRAYELWPVEAEDEEELLVEDLPQKLGEVQAPTLVLVGAEDVPDMQVIAQRLASEIPGARFEKIANTAHVPSMERPEEFDRLVLGFLESVT